MIGTESNLICDYLRQRNDDEWREMLRALVPQIHPVDQDAVRIWFSFWPPRLFEVLKQEEDVRKAVQKYELDGRFQLAEQLDQSFDFLYGSRYWPEVKTAIREYAETGEKPEGNLTDLVRSITADLVTRTGIPQNLLLGITAAGLMALRHVGMEAFSKPAERPPDDPKTRISADQLVKERARKREKWFNFFRTVDRKHTVIFDEWTEGSSFEAINGQDISSAAGTDRRDYQELDPRRIEGPIPFQCRSGSCGYCWVGVLAGRERLSEASGWEKQRLRFFGYDFGNWKEESHPPVRLSCQALCYGDVRVVIPPWNGVLKTRTMDRLKEE